MANRCLSLNNDHTHTWVRGEGIDMAVLSVVGLVLLLTDGLWRIVATPLGQALVIPSTLVALLFLSKSRQANFPVTWEKSKTHDTKNG